MSDERDGSNGESGQPPQDIPPAAAAPPPLASAPPPLAAAPPPPEAPPPIQPARPFLSPAAIIAILFGLVIVLLAVLYFTGVLDRSPRQAEQAPVVGTPAAPAPSAGGLMGPGPSEALNPPCDNVRNARDVAGSPPREGEQRNLLAVTAGGTYLWNGVEVDAVRLRQYLDIVSSMAPTPVTVVQVDPGAPPAAVEELRETIGRALRCEFRPT